MKIWDFQMEQPNVESRYLKGINVERDVSSAFKFHDPFNRVILAEPLSFLN